MIFITSEADKEKLLTILELVFDYDNDEILDALWRALTEDELRENVEYILSCKGFAHM